MNSEHLRVVHEHIDFLELGGQLADELPDLLHVTDVELDDVDLDALRDALNLLLDFVQRLLAARRQDKLQVVGLRARKLQRGALPDSRTRTCHQDRLAGKALGLAGAHSGEVVGEVEVQVLYNRAGLMAGDEATEDLGMPDKISWAGENHVRFESARGGNWVLMKGAGGDWGGGR